MGDTQATVRFPDGLELYANWWSTSDAVGRVLHLTAEARDESRAAERAGAFWGSLCTCGGKAEVVTLDVQGDQYGTHYGVHACRTCLRIVGKTIPYHCQVCFGDSGDCAHDNWNGPPGPRS